MIAIMFLCRYFRIVFVRVLFCQMFGRQNATVFEAINSGEEFARVRRAAFTSLEEKIVSI